MSHEGLNNKKVLQTEAELFLSGIGVGCLIFGFKNKSLHILLNRFKNYDKWMVPGGFVFKDESVDKAALRILNIRTGLSDIFLQQFKTFGNSQRASTEEMKTVLRLHDIEPSPDHWLLQRIVSVCYYAFVDLPLLKTFPLSDEYLEWFKLDSLPKLFGDDNIIIQESVNYIREHIDSIPLDYQLLPKMFTMSELQGLYEAVLGGKLDPDIFQQKILLNRYVELQEKPFHKMAGRPIKLYSFNRAKFKEYENRLSFPMSPSNRHYLI